MAPSKKPTPGTEPIIIDLDAARAERAKQLGEAPRITFGGMTEDLPHELPAMFLEYLAADMITDALKEIVSQKFFDNFMEQRPSIDDLEFLSDHLAKAYGIDNAKN